MFPRRLKPVVAIAAFVLLVLFTGARTLHSENREIGKAVTRVPVAKASPCSLCDTPDGALLPSTWNPAVLTIEYSLPGNPTPQGPHGLEDFVQYVRPPPLV